MAKNDEKVKPLTREQINRIQYRMEQFRQERRDALLKMYTTTNATQTVASFVRAVQDGRLHLKMSWKGDEVLRRNSTIGQLFGDEAFPEPTTLAYKAFEAAERKLLDEYHTIMDELLLGDAKEALALMRKFRAG